MVYNRFEDLPVWQESREFVRDVYKVISEHKKLKVDFSLNDQLKRASYSIMLNIAEGFERSSNTEFANYINIAKGSAGEVRSILYILLDLQYINEKTFQNLYKKINEISKHLVGFRKFLKQHQTRKK